MHEHRLFWINNPVGMRTDWNYDVGPTELCVCKTRCVVKLRVVTDWNWESVGRSRYCYCIVLIALSRCNRVFTRRLRLCHSHTVYRREVREGDREGPNRLESEV